MKKYILEIALVFATLGIIILGLENEQTKIGSIYFAGNKAMVKERMDWEISRLKDPTTGKIPENIRVKELEFASKISVKENAYSKNENWILRGPYNVGGRTRAAAIDIENDNRILAGGISGGIWETTDFGNSWTKITPPDHFHNVSCMVQDNRAGKTNNWYYGTGEAYGTSAAAPGAFHYGGGIYKSSDNGLSWTVIEATQGENITSFDSNFDFVWRVGIDPAIDTADFLFAATYSTIQQSFDGGLTWENAMPGGSYFTDLAVSSTGVIYATLSSEGSGGGIWRSEHGQNWTRINPLDTFPEDFDRIVLAINPSNENEVYFLAVTPGEGQITSDWYGEPIYTSLWKYTFVSGDGTDSTNIWENLSSSIPNIGQPFDQFNPQGSYNLAIAVKPDDPSIIFIGGTNVYRSTDAFQTQQNITQIGGYKVGTSLPYFELYENHHPDQHVLLFLPSNPDILITGNDGGMYKTTDCMANIVSWERMNNGYITTQLYTASVDFSTTNDILVGGFQDNGNFFTNSSDPTSIWTMPLNGDGSHMAIAPNSEFYILSIQKGKIAKLSLDANGEVLGFTRIDPAGGKKDNYLFINPLVMDPNNKDILYVGEGAHIWRNDQLSGLQLNNQWDSISTGWHMFSDTIPYTGRQISALAVSTNPANILYIGTNAKFAFKIENANTGDPELSRITPLTGQDGNISCIAVDPEDADNVMLVYSNYGIKSLWHSENPAPETSAWVSVSGNLEETPTGGGNGPSCRWATILPVSDGKLYLVATSTGLYGTDTLIADSTKWVQLGMNSIGNVVVEMVISRSLDGLVVAATHGNGIFSTNITSVNVVQGEQDKISFNHNEVILFPNPASDFLNVEFPVLKANQKTIVEIIHQNGKMIQYSNFTGIELGKQTEKINLQKFTPGAYYCKVSSEYYSTAKTFVVR